MICADFAQFSTLRNFELIFSITKNFAKEINFRQRQNFSVWDLTEYFHQTVKFVLCAGNTQSLHFSCADTAYVGMQSMELTLVLPNPFQAVNFSIYISQLYIAK